MLKDWNDDYVQGELPWDTGKPDPHLVELVSKGEIKPGRTLEIGCGTGTNALWLASHGFDTLGVDLAPKAIELANTKRGSNTSCRFETLDFMQADPPGAPFDFIFDRGCFHIFDDAEVRKRFAARVAALLAEDGRWLSLLGSTEGPAREFGPPRRSARDIINDIEPSLELLQLHGTVFDTTIEGHENSAKAWICLSTKRKVPAQPSTKRG